MKKILISLVIILILGIGSICNAQTQPMANSSSQIIISVGASPVIVLPYDTTNIDWRVHPETGAIRCASGLYNGNPPTVMPTASTGGMDIAAPTYYPSFPYIPPQLSLYCISESGTVAVDVQIDKK